jgi:hypothetical protein
MASYNSYSSSFEDVVGKLHETPTKSRTNTAEEVVFMAGYVVSKKKPDRNDIAITSF